MAKQIILSMHVSLDGYVAGPKGEMDWIRFDDELFRFVGEFTEEADTALYGRKTWEIMDAYWPKADQKPNAGEHDRQHAAWYRRVTRIVLSRSMKGQQLPQTKIISENAAGQVKKIKEEQDGRIMIFGSPGAVQELIEHGLVDDFYLFVNPIALNEGIPLFRQKERIKLKLVNSRTFSPGIMWLHYQPA